MTTELFPYTHGPERSHVYQTYERREGRSGKRERKWNDIRVDVIIDHSTRPPILQDQIGSLRGTLCKPYVRVGSLSRNERGLGRAIPTELSSTLTRTNASSGTDIVSAEERSRARGSCLSHAVAKLPYQYRKPYCRGSYSGNRQVLESTIHGLGFMPAVPRKSRHTARGEHIPSALSLASNSQ